MCITAFSEICCSEDTHNVKYVCQIILWFIILSSILSLFYIEADRNIRLNLTRSSVKIHSKCKGLFHPTVHKPEELKQTQLELILISLSQIIYY